jgi:hypothetical protein
LADADLPSVTFSNFVISLASTAMVHLGAAPDPDTGARTADLPMARHTIDALGMLEEKTRNNLDADEQKLLASVLAELRTKFVEASRARK